MPITQVPSQLFTAGRACAGPIAVVLHGYSSGLEVLDLDMGRCPRPKPAQSPGCHSSFHYGVDGCTIHQYVGVADTAWGFGLTVPTCPAPICPPDECESCTGLTVGQYNPDLDTGVPPVLPLLVAGPDGTANCGVIHIALPGQSGYSGLDAYGQCCRSFQGQYDEVTGCDCGRSKYYLCLVKSLCEIFGVLGLVPTVDNLLIHCNELICLDVSELVADIIACINAPPPPPIPCQCTPTTAQFCASLATVPAGAVAGPGTILLGADCQTHALPPAADVIITGVDTASVDITVTEAPDNNFTISAVLTPTAVCDQIANQPLGAPTSGPFLGPDCQFHNNVVTPAQICAILGTLPLDPVGGNTFFIGADCEVHNLQNDFCALLATQPVSAVPATLAIGQDCQWHPVAAAVTPADVCDALAQFTVNTPVPATNLFVNVDPLTGICGIGTPAPLGFSVVPADTACFDMSVVEAPAGVFTVSGLPIISPDVGNRLTCTANGLFSSPFTALDLCAVINSAPLFPVPIAPGNLLFTAETGCDNQPFPSFCELMNAPGFVPPTVATPAVNVLGDDCQFHPVAAALLLTDCSGDLVAPGASILTHADLTAAVPDPAFPPSPEILTRDSTTGCLSLLQPNFNCAGLNQNALGMACDNSGLQFGKTDRIGLDVLSGLPSAANLPLASTRGCGGIADVYVITSITINGTIAPIVPELCGKNDFWIKNATSAPITFDMLGGALVDGAATPITLEGQVTGGYPFGNNGGESIHLVWDAAAGTYWVL